MVKEKIERKIAVIFATDVVGYSKHMETDESETIHNLRQCEAVLTGLFEKHEGRLFNTGGDSFLAEFSSAVTAVECAVDFQHAIKARNASDEATVKLEFRIGINSGDVVKEKDNLLGDGVNIAARLEALAQTNGITVSKVIYDYVKGKTKYEFNDLGLQKVKQNEFHAYDLMLDGYQKRQLSSSQAFKSYKALIGICIASIFLVAVFYWFNFNAESTQTRAIQDRPYLVIMPFENLTGDKDNEYITLGLGISLSSTLSKNERLIVPSEETGRYLKESKSDDEEIFKKYGYRYILRGNIQGSAQNLRINVKMNDLEKNEVIWSEVYDFKNKDDIFEVQDLLASSVLRELELKFSVGGSGDALSENPEVYKRQLLGWSAFQYKNSENHVKAEQYFNEALEMEPDNPYLKAAMGWIILQKVELKLSSDPKKDIEKALNIAKQTIQEQEIFSGLALAHVIERKRKNYKNACPYVPKMAEHARSATEFATMGRAQWACDDVQGAISSFERVSLVAPHYSSWYKLPFAFVLTEGGDFQRAKEYMIKELPNLNKARQERLYMLLTYSHLKLGEINLAEEMYNKWQGQKRDKTAERVVWYLRNNKENKFAKKIISAMEPLSLPPS